MPKTWQAAAPLPWQGARAIYEGRSFLVVLLAGDKVYLWDEKAGKEHLPDAYGLPLFACRVNLADPDTRAVFDRRLALRLGAPAGAVEEGVRFYAEHRLGWWWVDAGVRHDRTATWSCGLDLDTDDPLLARALAWRSLS